MNGLSDDDLRLVDGLHVWREDAMRYMAERDALAARLASVEALIDDMGCSRLHTQTDVASGQHNVWCNGATWSRATVEERFRAVLGSDAHTEPCDPDCEAGPTHDPDLHLPRHKHAHTEQKGTGE